MLGPGLLLECAHFTGYPAIGPARIRARIIDLALEDPELSPREIAVCVTGNQGYFRFGSLSLPVA
jgi:hypothetical protein